MSPQTLTGGLLRPVPVLQTTDLVRSAASRVLEADVPALPVADPTGRLRGIFGEREFLAALFPGYLGELRSAAFVTAALDEAIGRRASCAGEPVGRHLTTDHVEIEPKASDLQVAETFLHHRVLIIPVVEGGLVTGVVTRSDFFMALVERFTAGP